MPVKKVINKWSLRKLKPYFFVENSKDLNASLESIKRILTTISIPFSCSYICLMLLEWEGIITREPVGKLCGIMDTSGPPAQANHHCSLPRSINWCMSIECCEVAWIDIRVPVIWLKNLALLVLEYSYIGWPMGLSLRFFSPLFNPRLMFCNVLLRVKAIY